MRLFTAALGALLVSLSLSGSALAGWWAPQYVSVSPTSLPPALAVDARGDAAVAWANEGIGLPGRYLMSVHARVRMADGRAVTRKLWSSNDARPLSLSVVLGAGEVTVVWVSDNRAHATPVLRAVYGPLIGRLSRPRVIGRDPWERGYPPTRWFGGLAVAPDGEVLVTFNR